MVKKGSGSRHVVGVRAEKAAEKAGNNSGGGVGFPYRAFPFLVPIQGVWFLKSQEAHQVWNLLCIAFTIKMSGAILEKGANIVL